MPSSTASGTQTATLGTAHILATVLTPGTYTLVVDLTALAFGETITLTLHTKALSNSASSVAYSYSFVDTQQEPLRISPPVPSLYELVVTLQQDGGTGRSFPWNLIRLDA